MQSKNVSLTIYSSNIQVDFTEKEIRRPLSEPVTYTLQVRQVSF